MISKAVIPTDVRLMAIGYGEYLMTMLKKHPGIVCDKTETPGSANRLVWCNPENIDTGYAGLLLLLIELFEQTGEPEYQVSINSSIGKLMTWCRGNATANYSLYTGRAGVVYLLLRWYHITKDKELLACCLELIVAANREYLHSAYTSNYLYDGRAGTLLVMIHLYKITQEPFLLKYINEFVSRIFAESRLVPGGICWTSEAEINLGPSPGFAYGAAGIRYVLGHLDNYTTSADLQFILAEIDRFIQYNLDEQLQLWSNPRKEILNRSMLQHYRHEWQHGKSEPNFSDHGWAEGTTGILFQSQQNAGLTAICTGSCNCRQVGIDHFKSNDLHSGLSGWGMYLLEECEAKRNKVLPQLLQHLAWNVHDGRLSKNIHGGLMHGEAGVAFFLLRATGNIKSDNILAPFRHFPLSPLKALDISIDRAEIKKNWLNRHYPRTLYHLQSIANKSLNDYMEEPACNLTAELVRFGHFVKELHLPGEKQAQLPCLLDLYEFEKEKTTFVLTHQVSPFEIMMREWNTHQEALEHLNKNKSWLLSLELSLSPYVKLLVSKWDWSFADDFGRIRDTIINNFNLQSSAFEYIVQVSRGADIVETALKEDTLLLLHLFNKPARVQDVLSAIRQYVSTLSYETLQQMLISITGNSNVPELIEHLDDVVLFKVRQWIYRGILSINA